jgi:hypothetical protein
LVVQHDKWFGSALRLRATAEPLPPAALALKRTSPRVGRIDFFLAPIYNIQSVIIPPNLVNKYAEALP